MMKSFYTKLLKVNLATREYKIINIPEDEKSFAEAQNDLDFYFTWFSESGLLHKDDKKAFEQFAQNGKLGDYLIYRRKWGNDYVHALMEYRPWGDGVMLCVRDIEAIYSKESKKIEEQSGRTDELTGLFSRKAYYTDTANYVGDVGVVYIDVNALKWTNDNKGHKAGDELIRKAGNLIKSAFPDFNCYHLSGDEFVLVAFDAKLKTFLSRVVAWHRWIWQEGKYPIMAVGYSVDNNSDVHSVTSEAERAMYVDKEIFYKRYPQYKRN